MLFYTKLPQNSCFFSIFHAKKCDFLTNFCNFRPLNEENRSFFSSKKFFLSALGPKTFRAGCSLAPDSDSGLLRKLKLLLPTSKLKIQNVETRRVEDARFSTKFQLDLQQHQV